MAEYLLDRAGAPELERERLARVEEYQDGPHLAALDALGVGAGWHCLDVGAGAGSVAAWLAQR